MRFGVEMVLFQIGLEGIISSSEASVFPEKELSEQGWFWSFPRMISRKY